MSGYDGESWVKSAFLEGLSRVIYHVPIYEPLCCYIVPGIKNVYYFPLACTFCPQV